MNQNIHIVPKTELSRWYKLDSQEHPEDQIIRNLLLNNSVEDKDSFLQPSLNNIPDPFELKDMREAISLLCDYLKNNKKILIIGDYDVDGVTSTALIIRFFRHIGYPYWAHFIPNRFTHGYGLTLKAVDDIVAIKPDLAITFDNGVSSVTEIALLKENGIDVIVTDHHTPMEGYIPDCLIVNPKQESCRFPEKDVAGVGVCFLFLMALRSQLRENGFWEQGAPEPNLLQYLDLVAIGTIADQVPLIGLNRVFARFGLEQINKKAIGDSKSGDDSYINLLVEQLKITFFDSQIIAFRVAPLLNAPGRMESADMALDFLLSQTHSEAQRNYGLIHQLNLKRRKKQLTMAKRAFDIIEEQQDQPGFFVFDESFHEGLTGIVANRIVDSHNLPTLVLTKGSEGIIKGSGRSKNENMLGIIQGCSSLLQHFGGHFNAAGCSLESQNLDSFKKMYLKSCKETNQGDPEKKFWTDMEVNLNMLTYKLLELLKCLEPFGQKNKKPLFMLNGVELPQPNIMSGKHVKWHLDQDLEMIYWDGLKNLPEGLNFDVAFTLEENIFRGERKRQLFVKAMSPAMKN